VAEIIWVDEFISEEWYPGFRPGYGHSPWVTEPVDTFKAGDQERFWFLDFHFPRGLSPMGMVFLEDGYSWATQLAARNLPLPRGNGIVQRLAGTHVYASVVPVDSEWEAGLRAERDQDRGTRGLQQRGDVFGLQQEVDRDRVAGSLRAPQRRVRLDQDRQHVRDAGALASEPREQVRCAPH